MRVLEIPVSHISTRFFSYVNVRTPLSWCLSAGSERISWGNWWITKSNRESCGDDFRTWQSNASRERRTCARHQATRWEKSWDSCVNFHLIWFPLHISSSSSVQRMRLRSSNIRHRMIWTTVWNTSPLLMIKSIRSQSWGRTNIILLSKLGFVNKFSIRLSHFLTFTLFQWFSRSTGKVWKWHRSDDGSDE